MRYGEKFETEYVNAITRKRIRHTVTYRYAEWNNFHTDNEGYGLWEGSRQIIGTCDFSVAGCKTEKAAKAKIRNRMKERIYG